MKGCGPRSGNGSEFGIRRRSDAREERMPPQWEKGCPNVTHEKIELAQPGRTIREKENGRT
jgi:hypothetical protein